MRASVFYRSDLWRASLVAARVLPRGALGALARLGAAGYRRLNSERFETVVRNLLPPLEFDQKAARTTARQLFQQFGLKLADLWRYESGRSMETFVLPERDWEHFQSVRKRGRGILLLTPHLGNWEFGAPLLRERGISLQVITQAEPQPSLTALRERSRRRWGIETLVIGENPFAFVEVIRRLDQGAVVALLVDRPPAASGVTVKLFGHRFSASIAPAELARACGCALLPTLILKKQKGYEIELLPEILYERTALGTREARANLTQEIMKVFEPAIRQNLDQWFHFVPLWLPKETGLPA